MQINQNAERTGSRDPNLANNSMVNNASIQSLSTKYTNRLSLATAFPPTHSKVHDRTPTQTTKGH